MTSRSLRGIRRTRWAGRSARPRGWAAGLARPAAATRRSQSRRQSPRSPRPGRVLSQPLVWRWRPRHPSRPQRRWFPQRAGPPPAPEPDAAVDPAVVSPAPAVTDVPAAQVTGREVTLAFGERRWRVRGLERASSFDVLRVNVMCSAPDSQGGTAFHVDTLDLYSA